MVTDKLYYCDRCVSLNSYPIPCWKCGHTVMIVKFRVSNDPPSESLENPSAKHIQRLDKILDTPGDNAVFTPETPSPEDS